jgi:hypothetical protein
MSRSRIPTPSELVFRHVTSNTALARKAKRVLESQLEAMARELTQADIPPKRRSEIILACAEIFRILDASIQSGSKLLVSPVRGAGHEPKPDPEVSVEDVFREITAGKPSRGSK